jgi:serine/threonine-protein kinase
VENLLGAGGMGEVYRARDTRLGRAVAIKVLPEEFASDPERVARLEREARVLAALNHSNIATLHGLEESERRHFLVMELVEGETLEERLKRGAIPVEEALRIGLQITDALEAAHEKGIVHRDLKPANVKITPDDKVKVLDFGLAKAMDSAPAVAKNLSNSPTLSLAATQAGVILGTAAYMSPEQAKGMEADARSDVFSFGCLFYEMLTGRQAFQGESVSEILAAVLIREPDLNGLPTNLNPRIAELLRRCLEKNPKRRWQAVGDLRAELELVVAAPRVALSSAASWQKPPLWKRALPIVITTVVFSAIAGTAVWMLRPAAPPPIVARFSIVLPEGLTPRAQQRHHLAVSPDGSRIVYVGATQLYMRLLSDSKERLLAGAGASVSFPCFSPNGEWVGFYSGQDGTLKKIAITGGAAVTIARISDVPFGIHWSDDWIVYGHSAKGIMRVSANGGEPEVLIPFAPGEGVAAYPQLLDHGRAVLFTVASTPTTSLSRWDQAMIVVQSLASNERTILVRGGSDARYVSTGHIVYALGPDVLAIPFDLKSLEVKGSSKPVLEGVMKSPPNQTGVAHFAFSDTGTLIYYPAGADADGPRTLALANREGKMDPLPLNPGGYETPRFSPDGKQIAYGVIGDQGAVSIYALSDSSSPRRLALAGSASYPIWSRDGRYLYFRMLLEGKTGVFRQFADGTGGLERLSTADPSDYRHIPLAFDASGRILFEHRNAVGADSDMWIFSPDGDRKPSALFQELQFQSHPSFSPNGRWMAYMSNEQGPTSTPQIYIRPYPITDAKYPITTEGGGSPLWSPDGKELIYYWSSKLYSVGIQTEPGVSSRTPAPLKVDVPLQSVGAPRNWDLSPDGKRFIVVMPAPSAGEKRADWKINVVLNWTRELQQRVPVK